jgi:hypothetical protein
MLRDFPRLVDSVMSAGDMLVDFGTWDQEDYTPARGRTHCVLVRIYSLFGPGVGSLEFNLALG